MSTHDSTRELRTCKPSHLASSGACSIGAPNEELHCASTCSVNTQPTSRKRALHVCLNSSHAWPVQEDALRDLEASRLAFVAQVEEWSQGEVEAIQAVADERIAAARADALDA